MLKLFNTLTREKEDFQPLRKDEVGLYNCGPTVYDFAHIGNLRSYVFADLLRRTLEWSGLDVQQVVNITDVGHLVTDEDSGEDKMMKALGRDGMEVTLENMKKIALKYEGAFLDDLNDLNIQKPDVLPRASEHIEEDIEVINKLEEKGFTYRISSGIYFDTSMIDNYGKLGGLSNATSSRLKENPEKKDVRDFALWKVSRHGDLGWPSPWGIGFPGWHIECSAMSRKYLGQPFDIHTGGVDHIPVHHNNEIAQSESAFDEPLARFWLHNEHILVDGEKMSKSLNNTYTLSDIIDKGFGPLSLRYWYLGSHYRNQANFTWQALEASHKALKRLKGVALSLSQSVNEDEALKSDSRSIKEFRDAIYDDLNSPKALGILWDTLRDDSIRNGDKFYLISEADKILSLELLVSVERNKVPHSQLPERIQSLLEKRQEARDKGRYNEADKLRADIEKHGFSIVDKNGETEVTKRADPS